MTLDHKSVPRGRLSPQLALLSAVALMTLALLKLTGCAGRGAAEADSRETRLTHDEVVKYSPRYSPDHSTIAYAASGGKKPGMLAVFVIPSTGGEPRKISPDSLSVQPLAWSDDGQAVLCSEGGDNAMYRIGLDGSIRLLRRGETLTHMLMISPDGKTELLSRFNEDNRDIMILKAGSKPEYLVETPGWESEASFGPRPDEVTVVSVPSYQAPVSTISVWSPASRVYTPLPLPEGQKSQPAWSPDRTLLAYTAMVGGQSDVWVYDSRTTHATPLVEDHEDASWPAWSPNGDEVAIVRSTRTSHLFAGEPGAADRRQLTDGPAYDFALKTSPDGKWIAFLRRPPASKGEPGAPVLCVMPASGGEVRELDLKGITLPSSGSSAAWSADSRQLAFNASDGSSKMDIYRIRRDGEELARVTVEPGEEVEPQWSPDGNFIEFTQAGAGRLQVAIVPAHGGLPRVISPEGSKCESGVWSPRSERMAHVAYRNDGHFEIWITPIAAIEQRRRLLENEKPIWPLSWTADGQELLAMERVGRNWTLQVISVESGIRREVGRLTPLVSGKDELFEFATGAEKYRKLVYPAGVMLADGQDRSDLFVVRARESLRARAAASTVLRWPLGVGMGLRGAF